MSTTKAAHTAGPWRQNGNQVEGPRMGLVVAIATSPRIGWAPKTEEEGRANARLIAAAPELLAALKGLRHACQHMIGSFDADDIGAFEAASAAITKATGRD